MHELSRLEKHENLFYSSAENGGFETKNIILNNQEVKDLRKAGFTADCRGLNENSYTFYDVSWKEAFINGVPLTVYYYISGQNRKFPKNLTFAQELYVIAARVNFKKAQTNNK